MASMKQKDIEQKEWVDRSRFVETLREWIYALEHNNDLNVLVAGNSFIIPSEAARRAHFRLEYEIDGGEHEFELTMKWQ